MKKILTSLALVVFSLSVWAAPAESKAVKPTRDLIERIAPQHSANIELALLPKKGGDRFELSSNGDKIVIAANKAMARFDVEGDGDPLDICVLTEKDVTHGDILVTARPIGGIRLLDHNQADDKIIAVLKNDAVYGDYEDIEQLPVRIVRRLIHYFTTYKDIPGENHQRMQFLGIYGRDVARDVIARSMEDYKDLVKVEN